MKVKNMNTFNFDNITLHVFRLKRHTIFHEEGKWRNCEEKENNSFIRFYKCQRA